MPTLQEQFDALVEQINRWDDRHRAIKERFVVAMRAYYTNPQDKAVRAEYKAAAVANGPYQTERNRLAEQARALEAALRAEKLAAVAQVPRPAPVVLAEADYARHQATLDTLLSDSPPASTVPLHAPQQRTLQIGDHQRTIVQKPITFTCAWCGHEHTELHYPGNPPKYGAECMRPAKNAQAAERMRRRAARLLAEAGQLPRPRGRPKKT